MKKKKVGEKKSSFHPCCYTEEVGSRTHKVFFKSDKTSANSVSSIILDRQKTKSLMTNN